MKEPYSFPISDLVESLRNDRRPTSWLLGGLLFLFGYLPSWLYRWSLKGIAVVYLPLVWVTITTIDSGLSTKDLLKRIAGDDEIEKLRRAWSSVVFALLAAKTMVVLGWVSAAALLERIPSGRMVDVFLQPESTPAWQYAMGINALLTFGLFLFAARAQPYVSESAIKRWHHTKVERTVEAFAWSRGLVSLYSIGAVLYIFTVESFNLPWPPLGTGILP